MLAQQRGEAAAAQHLAIDEHPVAIEDDQVEVGLTLPHGFVAEWGPQSGGPVSFKHMLDS